MPPKNIFAYTAPGASFPAYVSLNLRDDGRIFMSVRGPALSPRHGPRGDMEGEPVGGVTIEVEIPREVLEQWRVGIGELIDKVSS